jgi:hypothetical protein
MVVLAIAARNWQKKNRSKQERINGAVEDEDKQRGAREGKASKLRAKEMKNLREGGNGFDCRWRGSVVLDSERSRGFWRGFGSVKEHAGVIHCLNRFPLSLLTADDSNVNDRSDSDFRPFESFSPVSLSRNGFNFEIITKA